MLAGAAGPRGGRELGVIGGRSAGYGRDSLARPGVDRRPFRRFPAQAPPHVDATPTSAPDVGERLAALGPRLRLLLCHLAGRAVRARAELDDLAQEVFLRAVASPGGLPEHEPGEGALWRYLSRLARNTVVDVARSIRAAKRAGRTLPLARSDWSRGPRASQILAETAGPATRAVAGETSRRLAARFQALAPEHRRVIGLRQFEGLSARETARRMGRSESAVHSLYRRALAAWGAGGPDPEEARDRRDESGPP